MDKKKDFWVKNILANEKFQWGNITYKILRSLILGEDKFMWCGRVAVRPYGGPYVAIIVEDFQGELSVRCELWVMSYELWACEFVEYWGAYAPKNLL